MDLSQRNLLSQLFVRPHSSTMAVVMLMILQRMGLFSVFATALLRPPALVNAAFAIRRLPGALGRTAAGVALYAASGSNNNNNNKPTNQNQNNPSFSSFMSDIASSLLGGGKTVLANSPDLDQKLEAMAPSWESVRSMLEMQQTPEERCFRENLLTGYGVASPLHKVRLYDKSNSADDIRVKFYRDSASWCPYCQKVWIALEEKKIPYRIEKVNMRCYGDKPASFQAMQPSGQIPVAIIDGKVLRQSNDILYALDEAFPETKSLAAPKGQEMRAQELLRLERQLFSAWMYWLTSGGDAERLQAMFEETLNTVEKALQASEGSFFLGNSLTIVDVQFAPFLERMAASLLYFKGFQMRVAPGQKSNNNNNFPAINRWFDAMEQLPSYQLTMSDYYTHCWDLPPQLGGCVSEPAGAVYERAINGERRLGSDDDDDTTKGSWELPLQPHNGGVEPDWAWAGNEAAARREAVERVSANWSAIVTFAARGAGRKGMPPVSAPLADPNATPNTAVQGAVSSVLRVVCAALLEGSVEESHDATMVVIGQTIVKEGGSEFATSVINSLAYLRDRIGVPRDMKLPAARQLRAHLNWAIGTILEAQDR